MSGRPWQGSSCADGCPFWSFGPHQLLIVAELMATNLLFGYACCMIAGIGFAVNYLPVKFCDTGDGIFFSAAMSAAGFQLHVQRLLWQF